jgi:hypothetical protein
METPDWSYLTLHEQWVRMWYLIGEIVYYTPDSDGRHFSCM